MKGLLLKDFYMTVKCLGISFVVIIIFLLMSFFTYGSGFSFFVIYPVILAGLSVITLLSYDEKSRWNIYSITLPVSRKQIVAEKYLFSLMFITIIWVVLAIVQAMTMIINGGFVLEEYLVLMALFMLFGIIGPSVMLPVIFKCGVEKGRILYYIVIGVLCSGGAIAATASESIFDIKITANHLAAGIFLFNIVVFVISWLISIKIYEKRDL